MPDKHIILRRTIHNEVIIENGRFIGTAPTYKQAEEIASMFKDDSLRVSKALTGFSFIFYVQSYE